MDCLPIRRPGSDKLQDRLFHFLRSKGAGIQILGVGSLSQWSLGPGTVPLIPLGHLPSDLLLFSPKLGSSPPGPLLRDGIQVNLHLSVRKHDGPDIPAFHHDGNRRGDTALLLAHGSADPGAGGDLRRGFTDLRRPNCDADVFVVQEDPNLGKLDPGLSGELFQPVRVLQRDPRPKSPERHSPVHGACIDVNKAQTACDGSGDGALSSPGRTIYGDNDALNRHSIGGGLPLARVAGLQAVS
jgi:hypothetical protein